MLDKRKFIKSALVSVLPAALATRALADTPADESQNSILAVILSKMKVAVSGSSGFINYYNEALINMAFRGVNGGAASTTTPVKVTRIGRVVTVDILSHGEIVPTNNSIYLIATENLPAWAVPAQAKQTPIFIRERDSYLSAPGYLYINGGTGRIDIYRDFPGSTSFTNGARCGFYHTQITYTL